MDPWMIAGYVLLVAVLGLGCYVLYVLYASFRLPYNNPARYLKKRDKRKEQAGVKKVVTIGDSITHGHVGWDWVGFLRRELNTSPEDSGTRGEPGLQGFEVINAGVNSETAYNVLLRLEEIIACDPDFVTILIGTNDAHALGSEQYQRLVVKLQDLPRLPDPPWYRECLARIVRQLQERTRAAIAVFSLPLIGEDPNHFMFKLGKGLSRLAIDVARETGIAYLPLQERMMEALGDRIRGPGARYEEKQESLMIGAVARKWLLGQSWDIIGEKRGFLLHVDYLHLNSKGGKIVAGLAREFIQDPGKFMIK